MTKFLRALVSAVGIVVAYALMGLGGGWDVLGIALFVCGAAWVSGDVLRQVDSAMEQVR